MWLTDFSTQREYFCTLTPLNECVLAGTHANAHFTQTLRATENGFRVLLHSGKRQCRAIQARLQSEALQHVGPVARTNERELTPSVWVQLCCSKQPQFASLMKLQLNVCDTLSTLICSVALHIWPKYSGIVSDTYQAAEPIWRTSLMVAWSSTARISSSSSRLG